MKARALSLAYLACVAAPMKLLAATARSLRFTILLIRFLPLLALVAVCYAIPPPLYDQSHSGAANEGERRPNFYERLTLFTNTALTRALARSGPAFVKLAQYASTRPDVLPHALCTQLGALQDDTEPHSWAESEKALVRALGEDWEDVLCISEHDKLKPVGSGCIAQVYMGKMRSPDKKATKSSIMTYSAHQNAAHSHTCSAHGHFASADADRFDWDDVAIKIIHPSAQWVLSRDLAIVRTIARLACYIPPLRDFFALMPPLQLVHEFELLM